MAIHVGFRFHTYQNYENRDDPKKSNIKRILHLLRDEKFARKMHTAIRKTGFEYPELEIQYDDAVSRGKKRLAKSLRKAIDDGLTHKDVVFRNGYVQPRCQRKAFGSQMQCKRPAINGERFCRIHRVKTGARRPLKSALKHNSFRNLMYGTGKSQELKEALDKVSKKGDDVLRIDEEINIARLLVDRSLDLFDRTCVNTDGKNISIEIKLAAQENLRRNIQNVAKIAEQAANVYSKSDKAMNMFQAERITSKLIQIVIHHLAESDRATCDLILDEFNGLIKQMKSKLSDDDDMPIQIGFEEEMPEPKLIEANPIN